MTLRACIHYPAAVYHVMLCGNGGRLPVWNQDHLSLTDLWTLLGRGPGSLNQAVRRLRQRVKTNPRLAGELERIREDLEQIIMFRLDPDTTLRWIQEDSFCYQVGISRDIR